MLNFYQMLMKNQVWLVIVLLIVTIIVLVFNSKFRAKVYNLIAQAEVGDLSKESLAKTIDKVQQGDLDERMVLVMASIVQLLPVLNLVPKSILVPFLNKYTQKAFDRIKLALRAVPKSVNVEIKAELVSTTVVDRVDILTDNVAERLDNLNEIEILEQTDGPELKDMFGRLENK